MAAPGPTFEKIASRFELRIREGLIEAFNILRNQHSTTALENILRNEGIEGVMRTLDDMDDIIAANISDSLDDAIRESGRASLQLIPSAAVDNPNFRFSQMNPNTSQFIQKYELDLIQQISNETREAIRQSLTADIVSGRNPRDTARQFRANIGLTRRQEQAVRNYRTALEELDPTALQRKLRDGRYDKTIRRAIREEKPLSQEQVTRMTDRYRERYIRHRATTIARTESLRATSVGNGESINQMIESGAVDPKLVRKYWSPTRDNRTRPAHREIPALNPDGRFLDEAFVTRLGPLRYPRDPLGTPENTINCRCSLKYKLIERR